MLRGCLILHRFGVYTGHEWWAHVERIQTGSYHMGYTERDVFRVCMTQLTVRNYPSDLQRTT